MSRHDKYRGRMNYIIYAGEVVVFPFPFWKWWRNNPLDFQPQRTKRGFLQTVRGYDQDKAFGAEQETEGEKETKTRIIADSSS